MNNTYNFLFYNLNKKLSSIPVEKRIQKIKILLNSKEYKDIVSEDFYYTNSVLDEDEVEAENDDKESFLAKDFDIDKEKSILELQKYYQENHPELIGEENYEKKLKFGRTELHEAIINGNISEVVECLSEDYIDSKDNNGLTPCETAKIYGNSEIIEIVESYAQIIKNKKD